MDLTASQVSAWLSALAWPMLRVSGLVLVAPVFSARVVPARVRLVTALALTPVVAMLAPPPSGAFEPLSAAGFLVAVQQLLIGIAIGFAVQIAFDALEMAGQVVAMTMGLGFATLVDPARGAMTPVLSQFLLVVGVLLFVSFDGHLLLVGALADSFRWAPVGQVAAFGPDQALQLAGWAARIFESGLVIALPAVVALLAVNIGMGIVSRAAPQLNLFAVGFPAAMMAGFVFLLLSLPAMGESFTALVGRALGFVAALLGGGG
ncbi:MAG TPA: flagellar biosynthetic protein FliR [Solirubrobacteraceae bacterium]|nr:flagellar biosynthetic protein FliR [Solirubrobacteraceae bacterium]